MQIIYTKVKDFINTHREDIAACNFDVLFDDATEELREDEHLAELMTVFQKANIDFVKHMSYIPTWAYSATNTGDIFITPEHVKYINPLGLANMPTVKEIHVTGNVKRLGVECFGNCPNLETIVIEEGLHELRGGAFHHCWKLRDIYLPRSLSSISHVPSMILTDQRDQVIFHVDEDTPAHRHVRLCNYRYRLN